LGDPGANSPPYLISSASDCSRIRICSRRELVKGFFLKSSSFARDGCGFTMNDAAPKAVGRIEVKIVRLVRLLALGKDGLLLSFLWCNARCVFLSVDEVVVVVRVENATISSVARRRAKRIVLILFILLAEFLRAAFSHLLRIQLDTRLSMIY